MIKYIEEEIGIVVTDKEALSEVLKEKNIKYYSSWLN